MTIEKLKADVWERKDEIAGFTLDEMESYVESRKLACYESLLMRVVIGSLMVGLVSGMVGYVFFRLYCVELIIFGAVLGCMVVRVWCDVSYKQSVDWLNALELKYLDNMLTDRKMEESNVLEKSRLLDERVEELRARARDFDRGEGNRGKGNRGKGNRSKIVTRSGNVTYLDNEKTRAYIDSLKD